MYLNENLSALTGSTAQYLVRHFMMVLAVCNDKNQSSKTEILDILKIRTVVPLNAEWTVSNSLNQFICEREVVIFLFAIKHFVFRNQVNIFKTKSKLTLITTEYIFTVFDFNQIKYCNELLVPALA